MALFGGMTGIQLEVAQLESVKTRWGRERFDYGTAVSPTLEGR